MDPFSASPNATEPAPPPYLSQVEYDEKVADALQRSIVLQDVNVRRPNSSQRWSANSPNLQQTARQSPQHVVPLPSPPGTANTADSRVSALGRAGSSSSHHRQNSISSSSNGTASSYGSYGSSRHSKERPSWYNEAGLGGRGSGRLFVSSPATMSNGTSGPSSQPTSPAEEPGYQRRYVPGVLDEEAGIDNPPPSFQAALTAPTPGSLSPARSTPSARSSYDTVTSSSAFPNAASSSTSPRTSYDGHGAAPRLSAPQYPPHVGQRGTYSTSSVPGSLPEGRRRRGSSAASSSYGAAVGFAASLSGSGPVPITTNGNGPQLVVDKALAYGKTSSGGLPQGAAPPAPPATAFYGSAVSAILQAQAPNASAGPSSSAASMYSNFSSSSSRPVSQRDSTMVSMNSPNSYVVSPSVPNPTSSYTQAEPRRPPSAQSYMTNSSAPAGRTSLGERRASRESMLTTVSAPAFGPRDRHGRSSSTAFAGVQMTSMPPARPASSNDQRASYPGYPTSTSSPVRTPPPTDEFNPFAAAGVAAGPTPVAQQRQTNSGYYPAVVSGGPAAAVGTSATSSSGASTTRWMPPGAARPINLYDRRFS